MTLPDSLDKYQEIQQRVESSKDPQIMARIKKLQEEIEYLEKMACDSVNPELQEELDCAYLQFRADADNI